ncbi:hypothetical protein MOD31_10965 [Paenarthrobacter sp. TYUT067]|uniref:hypothetical protein n=1 Tax=Paenarthrobacter sp. TYUT067 TaxID=2926245 RepID=UPI0020300B2A|nr:hypothetical protein [Paenarthrobacter sp. TYUT067]MCM0616545.1 hypothetical protein [Paenarthrobacter sp. TYUT067]
MRLDDARLGLITALGVIDETTVAEQVRLAADSYIQDRLKDSNLPAKVEAAVERYRQGFASLLDGQPGAGVDSPAAPARDIRSEKQVTLRLEQRTIDFCTSLALLDGTTLADQIRAAIDAYTGERLRDPKLERLTQAARKDQDELLARLSKSA